jgi:hypothetical protein
VDKKLILRIVDKKIGTIGTQMIRIAKAKHG